jgi:hypothetical protein
LFINRRLNANAWFEAFSQRNYMHSLMILISKQLSKRRCSIFSIVSFLSYSALIWNHCTTVWLSSIRRRRNDSWSMLWVYDNHTSVENSSKWNEYDINNLIDFMIKKKTFSILKMLIDINMINININEWIERLTNKADD